MGQSQTRTQSIDDSSLRTFFDLEFENRIVSENLNFAHRRAVELIERRDMLGWEVLAAATTTVVLLAAGSIYKRKDLIIPIVPIIMTAGYRYDAAHGGNRETIREEAEKLLSSEKLDFVGGPITLKDVDEYRKVHFK